MIIWQFANTDIGAADEIDCIRRKY